MSLESIQLQLPATIYHHLVDVAEASHQSLTDVVLQSIRIGLPPTLTHVPERFRGDLKGLYQLSDALLWQVTEQDLAADKADQYEVSLTKNQQGMLSESERHTLTSLREEADLLMLRRSYAYALLRWRGHRIPTFFNPRQQSWPVHFSWSLEGIEIVGLTAIGRATILALRLNNPEIVASRSLWVQAGWHPPMESIGNKA